MLEQLVQALRGPFDVSSERTREAHYFRMDTRFNHFALNGKRLATESYLLTLQYMPQTSPSEGWTAIRVWNFMCRRMRVLPSLSLTSTTGAISSTRRCQEPTSADRC